MDEFWVTQKCHQITPLTSPLPLFSIPVLCMGILPKNEANT